MESYTNNSDQNKESDRIAIIGAGPSGIVCARELAKKGWKNVVLFEAQDRLGGKTKSLSLEYTENQGAPGQAPIPTVVEMGTQTVLEGPVLRGLLKDTGLDKELFNEPVGLKVRNLSDSKGAHPFFSPLSPPISFRQKALETLKFAREINRVKVLDQPGPLCQGSCRLIQSKNS